MMIDTIGFALATLGTGALSARLTLYSHNPRRRFRSRARMRFRPGAGFATFGELAFRWSRTAALHHGARVRPDMGFAKRLFSSAQCYSWRLGRAQYFKRVFLPQEHQAIIIAPPRVGKSGLMGEFLLCHRGAAVAFTTRSDLYDLTAGTRAQLGPVEVFNPYGVGNVSSTFRPDIVAGCERPETAARRAAALIGDTSSLGELAFWASKAEVSLAGLMHAAAVGGHDMRRVYMWANRAYTDELQALGRHDGISMELFAAVAEIFEDTKAASSIRMTLLRSLGWLAVPELAEMVCGEDVRPLDVGRFAASRSTLYMIMRDGDSSIAAPLFRLIVDLMHHEGNLAATKTRFRKHVPGVAFMIDEVANLQIPKLPQKLADSAGFGAFMILVCHSVAQLRAAYGEAEAAAIMGCCGTKIVMSGLADADTLGDISALAGKRPDSEDRDKAVLSPEIIRSLPASRALVIHADASPVVVKFRTPWRRWSYRLGRMPAAPTAYPWWVRPPLADGWDEPEVLADVPEVETEAGADVAA